MRRLRSSLTILAVAASTGAAQTQQSGSEGSLFLLLPTGAQAVGMGQAMAASKPGSEGVWWNPASLGGQEKKELAIHHSTTIAGVGDALSFVAPFNKYATAALSINILDLGSQDLTDSGGGIIGTAFPRDVVFAGSYAGQFSNRFSAGLNYKIVQLRVDCTGICGSIGPEVQSTRTVDLGAQYRVEAGAPLTFGVALRNRGGHFRSSDTNRPESLPAQVEVSALYRLKFIDQYVKDTQLHAAASLVESRRFGGRSVRLGADVTYQDKVHLRGGFVGHDQRNGASAALGFGLQTGGFVFDIARTFGGLPAENGTPVYVSLRYLF